MSTNHSTLLRHWIARHNAGDPQSTNELLRHSETRFRELAHDRLEDFKRLRRFVDTGDVLTEAQLRFVRAMRTVQFNTLEHFLALGALKIRQHLLDLKKKHYGPHGDGRRQVPLDPDGPEPEAAAAAAAAERVEVDEAIAGLAPDVREIFDLCYYQGLRPGEAAAALKVSVRMARRRWVEAQALLGKRLGEAAAAGPAEKKLLGPTELLTVPGPGPR